MTDKLKILWGALILAVIGLLYGYYEVLTVQVPVTSPSPSPAPIVSASPSPIAAQPSPSPTAITQYAMRGETLGFYVTAKGATLNVGTGYEIKTVKVTTPSFKGARTGDVEDALVEVTQFVIGKPYYVSLPISRDQAAGTIQAMVLGNQISVRVINELLPERPTMPLYMELTFAKVAAAHGIPDGGSTQAARGAINALYRANLRAHRIEPIKQQVYLTTSNIDQNSSGTLVQDGTSFRQTTLEGSIADPYIFSPNQKTTNLAYLLKQIPNGRAYPIDEPAPGAALPVVRAVASAAPLIPQDVTMLPTADTKPYVSRYVPVMEQFVPGSTPEYGLYVSCMSSGTCTNGTIGNATGTPNLAIDAAPIDARAFPVVAYLLGAKHALYYSAIESLGVPGTNQYIFGNNGDGNIIYVCPDKSGPCPSLREKRILTGMNDVEWLALAKRKGIALKPLVTSTKVWSRDEADYNNMRAQVAAAL